jgi:hypothetical protein
MFLELLYHGEREGRGTPIVAAAAATAAIVVVVVATRAHGHERREVRENATPPDTSNTAGKVAHRIRSRQGRGTFAVWIGNALDEMSEQRSPREGTGRDRDGKVRRRYFTRHGGMYHPLWHVQRIARGHLKLGAHHILAMAVG